MIDFREIFKTYLEPSVTDANRNESSSIHCHLMIEIFKDISKVDRIAYANAYRIAHELLSK